MIFFGADFPAPKICLEFVYGRDVVVCLFGADFPAPNWSDFL